MRCRRQQLLVVGDERVELGTERQGGREMDRVEGSQSRRVELARTLEDVVGQAVDLARRQRIGRIESDAPGGPPTSVTASSLIIIGRQGSPRKRRRASVLGSGLTSFTSAGGVEVGARHDLRQTFLALGLERFGDRPCTERGGGGNDASTPRWDDPPLGDEPIEPRLTRRGRDEPTHGPPAVGHVELSPLTVRATYRLRFWRNSRMPTLSVMCVIM